MNYKTIIHQPISKLLGFYRDIPKLDTINHDLVQIKILTARILINDMKRYGPYENINDSEFQVFSQFGDDGIIQYLIKYLELSDEYEIFIEFGVQNYEESNTRFLLVNNNWKGLILDANDAYINQVKNEELYWRHDLTAIPAFVDKNNINDLFESNGFEGEIGLLSIDIDGNDYWIWEQINVVNPVIVIIEYNSLFGMERAVTIPYEQEFDRAKAHYSHLYWGCSLKALALLGNRKGYYLVGCNSAGNNAYFVRKDRLGKIHALDVSEAYVKAKFREARDQAGNLAFSSRNRGLDLIKDMPLIDVETDIKIKVLDLFCQ